MSSYGVENSSRREESYRRDDSSRHNDSYGRDGDNRGDNRDSRNDSRNGRDSRDDNNSRDNRYSDNGRGDDRNGRDNDSNRGSRYGDNNRDNGRDNGGNYDNNRGRDDSRNDSRSNSAPYVSNPYGPNNHASMPAMLPDEGKKDWRARIRAEMEMRICVWPRSPSPPKQKNKPAPKAAPVKKEENMAEKHSSMKSKKHEKSEKSSKKDRAEKDKSDRKKAEKAERSERSERSEKSERSDKSAERNADRSVHFDPQEEDEERSHIEMTSQQQNNNSEMEMQKELHNALGLSEYERAEMEGFRRDVQGDKRDRDQDNGSDSDDDIGPLPMVQPKDYALNKEMAYGGALMPGEGAAIAMYVQQNMRIPRRGEIGWSGDEINGLEGEGYVMSGSRHKKMNAVRIRKENQVYSAEEKRALALITFEEKQQKDNKVVGDFREMLTHKLTASGHIAPPTEKTEDDNSE